MVKAIFQGRQVEVTPDNLTYSQSEVVKAKVRKAIRGLSTATIIGKPMMGNGDVWAGETDIIFPVMIEYEHPQGTGDVFDAVITTTDEWETICILDPGIIAAMHPTLNDKRRWDGPEGRVEIGFMEDGSPYYHNVGRDNPENVCDPHGGEG